MAKVTLQNLSNSSPDRKAGAVAAVNDVNVDIGDGEFAVVVGPARSGKSSLIRMIAGLEEIARGEILIGERRVNDVPPKDRDVAMVFRDYALYPRMSVYENMAFGLKLRKFAKAEIDKRVRDAAGILGIGPLLDCKPDALSAEQRLRVAIGRAMVRQPKVFLFEEPLANLDLPTQEKMRAEIAKLHQRLEATVIFTTQDSAEAMSLADRLIVLRDGILQQNDAPSAVYAAPANLFVAGFIGRPAMNLIHGTLKLERDALLFREIEGGTIEARLPVSDGAEAVKFAGKPVVLGIRPEDLVLAQASPSSKTSGPTFPAVLEVVEPNGAQTNLYLQTGAHTLVCRSPGAIDRGEAGRRMRFAIDPTKAHLFDPVSTARVAWP